MTQALPSKLGGFWRLDSSVLNNNFTVTGGLTGRRNKKPSLCILDPE